MLAPHSTVEIYGCSVSVGWLVVHILATILYLPNQKGPQLQCSPVCYHVAVIRQAFTRVEIYGATGARWSSGARHERPDHSGATRRGAVEPREHGRGGRVHDQRADRDVPDHRSTGFLRAEA